MIEITQADPRLPVAVLSDFSQSAHAFGNGLPEVQNAARKFQALQHGPRYSVLPSKVTSPDRGLNHRLGKMASRISSYASESSLEASSIV